MQVGLPADGSGPPTAPPEPPRPCVCSLRSSPRSRGPPPRRANADRHPQEDPGQQQAGARRAGYRASVQLPRPEPEGRGLRGRHLPEDRRGGEARAEDAGPRVAMEFVNSSSRIPLITNGTIDLECGTTTNNADRKKQVAFTNTHFLTATRFVPKKDQNIAGLDDLRGKTVASVAGSTNILMLIKAEQRTEARHHGDRRQGCSGGLPAARDRPGGGLRDGRRAAQRRGGPVQGSVRLRDQPGDPVQPGALRHHAPPGRSGLQGGGRPGDRRPLPQPRDHDDLRSWFLKPVPPRGLNYNVPLSSALRWAFAHPSDESDPAFYAH